MSNTYSYSPKDLQATEDLQISFIVTEWNSEITERMLELATKTLIEHGVAEDNITVRRVPGSFELVFGCAHEMDFGSADVIIALGCVIKGDTPHFDYICSGTTQGLVELNLRAENPVINGVLTVNTFEQALERAETKGQEFALTAIKMAQFSLED